MWDGGFRPGPMHDQIALRIGGIDDLLDQHPDVQAEMEPHPLKRTVTCREFGYPSIKHANRSQSPPG